MDQMVESIWLIFRQRKKGEWSIFAGVLVSLPLSIGMKSMQALMVVKVYLV